MQIDIPFRTVRANTTRQSADVLAKQMRLAGQTALKVHFDRCPKLLENRLAFLNAFDFLTHLALVEGEVESLASLQCLPRLKRLELSLLRVEDEQFEPLPSLEVLGIVECSRNVLQLLPLLESLRALSLMLLDAVTLPSFTNFARLRWLKVEQCHRLSSLNSLKDCTALERVVLLELQSLCSLESIAEAPHLRELITAVTPRLLPNAFAVFAHHPALERLYPGTSQERFRQATEMLRCSIMDGYYGTADQFFDLEYGDKDEFMIRLR